MDPEERALANQLESASGHLNRLHDQFFKLQQAIAVQNKVVVRCRKKLRSYPSDKYWSNVTKRTWPMDIVWMITNSNVEIAETLFNGRQAVYLSMIGPKSKVRAMLLIKHCLQSRSTMKQVDDLYDNLFINSWALIQRFPKWSKYKMTYDLRTMAVCNFERRRFTAQGMTMTWLGHEGIIKIDVGSDCQWMLKHLKDMTATVQRAGMRRLVNLSWTLLETKTGLVVRYKPIPEGTVVIYGGRPKRLMLARRF